MLSFVKKNPIFWSRLGAFFDPAMLDENGEMNHEKNYEQSAGYHRAMRQSGVKIHTSILFSGWCGSERYDYTLTDKTLESLFKEVPDAFYIPRIKLNAPLEWLQDNPSELFVYYGGPTDPESIRKIIGTSEHNILGYESVVGYMGKHLGANIGGLISNQSFASEKWQRDAATALLKLMEHLAASPYADRIIGYHIGYGVCGECCQWGRPSQRMGDYSLVMQKAFIEWGIHRYGTKSELLKIWGSLEIPPPERRSPMISSVEIFSRSRPQDRIVIDLNRFMSELNANLLENFCRLVKEKSEKTLLAGGFYGYMLECFNAAESGYLNFDKILNSPYIDFLAAPESYYRRAAGDSGGFMVPISSVTHHKIWIDEIDIRTHKASAEGCFMSDYAQVKKEYSRAVFYRDVAKNLAAGSTFWWMDLLGGWYDSPDILEQIQEITQKIKKINRHPGKSIADIAIIVDEESAMICAPSEPLHDTLIQETIRELTLTGALVDCWRLKDLSQIDLSNYKLLVFLNTVKINNESRNLIKNLKNTKMLFFYLDGGINNDFALEHCADITGVKLIPYDGQITRGPIRFRDSDIFSGMEEYQPICLPMVIPDAKNSKILALDGNNTPVMATSDQRRFYASVPFLKHRHLRMLAKYAGCQFYAEAPCTVYGDNRFIATFSQKKPEKFSFETKK